ncbi:MAG: glycoside hydrolase family 36 protein [Promethearchaeota archaeon]
MNDNNQFKQRIENNNFYLEFDLKSGFYDIISKKANRIVLKKAFGQLLCEQGIFSTLDRKAQLHVYPFESNLGEGTKYRIDFYIEKEENKEIENMAKKAPQNKEDIHFQFEIIQYKNISNILTIEIIATNNMNKDLHLNYFSPLAISADMQGGVFIEDIPENSIIYENGLGFAFEFFMRAINATEESDSSLMSYIYSKKDFGKNFLCGLLNPSNYIATIITNDELDEGIKIEDPFAKKERVGIAEYRAQILFPFPKVLHPGDSISSGVWILMVDMDDGFQALESYADFMRIYNDIRLWKYSVPHGWNSWGNPVDGFREYSYVTDINEEIILKNLDVAVENLKPFGLEYFQLDDGYTADDIMNVDEIIKERFPNGMKYIADKIHEKGLKAGIWINPFNVGINSKIVKEHPDWYREPHPTFPIKNKNWKSLDLSVPAVQNYIRHVIRKVVKEWGFNLLKVDFAYHNMGPTQFFDKDITAPEIHRLGWKIIREEAGPNVFIFGIGGPIGLHIGDVDGERIELDTLPIWRDPGVPQEMFDVPQTGGSISFNYRTIARKYYLNNRIWFNHLDCICFRPSVTRNETMCLVNAISLFGGIFKIGDKIIEMKKENLEVFQKMLPIYKGFARPLDLFTKLLPEIIYLPITKNNYQWSVVGIFNWGENKDLITEQVIPSREKEIVVNFNEIFGDNIDCEKCHVFDFWSQLYLGIFKTKFSVKMQPHFSNIYNIVPYKNIPQYISSNRHITQGGIEVLDESILSSESKILVKINCVKNFLHKLYFFIPELYEFKKYFLNVATVVQNITNSNLAFDYNIIDNYTYKDGLLTIEFTINFNNNIVATNSKEYKNEMNFEDNQLILELNIDFVKKK